MNLRMLGLAAVVVFTALLPLAGASAGPEGRSGSREARPVQADDKRPVRKTPPDSLLSGIELSGTKESEMPQTSAQCGPELFSPTGVEAQTCVLTSSQDGTWARTYYRNATGTELRAALSLMGPDGRTVQINCAVGAEDEPDTCETPREATEGMPGAYTAVAEFAAPNVGDPLLLRSGSNPASTTGS
ncbi:hypothetical protein [Streptomyces sp. NPDC051219]|uniref:hypothetical protein n=1 Tax=Streptomyces sp. NPDC051219 TaxID=3155283 RepID=UPI003433BC2A